MKLLVYASLAEDINNGWAWLPEKIVGQRNVIKLKNSDSGKSVFCEALQIGDNYLARYNDGGRTNKIKNKSSSIVLNEWYRKKLGIETTQKEYSFEVEVVDNPWGHIRASLHHPQIVVRIAVELAILSVILGIAGIIK